MSPLGPLVSSSSGVLRQQGQALLESLLAMLGLAVLWVALHWLAHYQDAALSATHASRHAAFAASRAELQGSTSTLTAPFFTGSAHRWTDRRGEAVLDSGSNVSLSWVRRQALSELGQPGAGLTHAATLRREWLLEDSGLLQARLHLDLAREERPGPDAGAGFLNLRAFDQGYPPLLRSTSLLTGAGHAASDSEAQSRVAASSLAWSTAHMRSRAAGSEIRLRAEGAEAGWGRRGPDFDWLQPWSGRVPDHLISEYETEGRN